MLTSAIEAALINAFSDWKHNSKIEGICEAISRGQHLNDPNRVLAVLHDMDKRDLWEIDWADDQPHAYRIRYTTNTELAY